MEKGASYNWKLFASTLGLLTGWASYHLALLIPDEHVAVRTVLLAVARVLP